MKILFVCSGNICRSPTAEAIFAHMVRMRGLEGRIVCSSAGTHGYHAGEGADIRACEAAAKRGYDMSQMRARQMRYDDFEDCDLILCMDAGHKLTLERVCRTKSLLSKVKMFDDADVGDPYYGGPQGFEVVLDQIEGACARWIDELSKA